MSRDWVRTITVTAGTCVLGQCRACGQRAELRIARADARADIVARAHVEVAGSLANHACTASEFVQRACDALPDPNARDAREYEIVRRAGDSDALRVEVLEAVFRRHAYGHGEDRRFEWLHEGARARGRESA